MRRIACVILACVAMASSTGCRGMFSAIFGSSPPTTVVQNVPNAQDVAADLVMVGNDIITKGKLLLTKLTAPEDVALATAIVADGADVQVIAPKVTALGNALVVQQKANAELKDQIATLSKKVDDLTKQLNSWRSVLTSKLIWLVPVGLALIAASAGLWWLTKSTAGLAIGIVGIALSAGAFIGIIVVQLPTWVILIPVGLIIAVGLFEVFSPWSIFKAKTPVPNLTITRPN